MSSHDNSINECSSCRQNLPISLFIRNQQTNTLYKTCITCRTRRNDRRQNLRRQRTDAPSPQVTSTNDTRLIGNESIADIIDPQIVDTEMEVETNSRETENTNLDFNLNNPAVNIDLKFCTQCKRNRTSNLFKGRVQSKIYKTCSDCRSRSNNRRRPLPYQAITSVESHLSSVDVDSVMKYCTMCKKNCPSNLFTNNTENTPYTTCSDCRSLERSRRYPPIFPTVSTE
ncbi:hypothetical protein EPUL_005708, partial [Erysiphe pulchra]